MMQQKLLDILIQQYDQLGSYILAVEDKYEKIATLVLTILTAGMVYGIQGHVRVLFLFVPFGLLWIISHNAAMLRSVILLGRYRKRLEMEINRIIGHKVMLWETVLIPRFVSKSLLNRFEQVLLFAMSAGLLGFSIYKVFRLFDPTTTIVDGVAILLLGLPLMVAAFRPNTNGRRCRSDN